MRVLEGMLLAAHAIEAEACWIYLRDEYRRPGAGSARCIAEMRASGIATLPIHLRRGAGAYICGEETALLESLEGKRGYPRHKPPYPGEHGPVRPPDADPQRRDAVVAAGDPGAAGAAYASHQGRRGGKGRRLFSVSGRVRGPA
jgi:formate dehydrogenase beta subunit